MLVPIAILLKRAHSLLKAGGRGREQSAGIGLTRPMAVSLPTRFCRYSSRTAASN